MTKIKPEFRTGWVCNECQEVWHKKTKRCPTCGSFDIEYFDLNVYDRIN